jgi:hypothetical protein
VRSEISSRDFAAVFFCGLRYGLDQLSDPPLNVPSRRNPSRDKQSRTIIAFELAAFFGAFAPRRCSSFDMPFGLQAKQLLF